MAQLNLGYCNPLETGINIYSKPYRQLLAFPSGHRCRWNGDVRDEFHVIVSVANGTSRVVPSQIFGSTPTKICGLDATVFSKAGCSAENHYGLGKATPRGDIPEARAEIYPSEFTRICSRNSLATE